MKNPRFARSVASILIGSSLPAFSAATIYEPFDYATGGLAGKGGATGLEGNTWSSSGDRLQAVVTTGLSFTGLSVAGGAVKRPSAPNGAESSIAITNAAKTALTADGSTIYFSLLVRNDRNSVGNENLTFAFGTGAFDGLSTDAVGGERIPNFVGGAAGEGFGIHLDATANGSNNEIEVYGYKSDGGAESQSAGFIDTDNSVSTFLVLGQIDWVANGGNDTMRLWNVSDASAFNPADSPFATMTADLDQSLFGTLAMESRQIATLDEIRFGTSIENVGISAIPEPSVALLGGLGALLLLRRRR